MKIMWHRGVMVVGIAVGLTMPSSSPAWTLEDVIEQSPLEPSQLPGLRAGKIITTPIVEAGKRELAIALACLVRDSAEDLLQPFLGDRPILPSEHLVESGEIHSEADWDALARSTLALRDADELARYLKATPGFTLNLSQEEMAEFRGIRGEQAPDQVGAVQHAIRRMLEDRYRGYRERGLAGISEYVRAKGDIVDPGELLEVSLESATALVAFVPEFQRAWRNYPKADFTPTDDTFFWASLKVDDRPTWLLSHRYAGPSVIGQRTFYVSHFFDAGTTVIGWIAVPEGRVFIFTNRLWLDRLSGFGSSIKRSLGRRHLSSQMKEMIGRTGICRSEP